MTDRLPAPHLGRWAVATAIAVVALLSFAAAANATIYRPADGDELIANIQDANANSGYDKILLPDTQLFPTDPLPAITDQLLISGNHANQRAFDGPGINAGSVDERTLDFITIGTGVKVDLEGFQLTLASTAPSDVIRNRGNLRLDGMEFVSNEGRLLENPVGSTAVLTNVTMVDNFGLAILSRGSLTVLNSVITTDTQGGIDARAPFVMRNSIVAGNSPQDCFNPTFTGGAAGQSNNLDADGSCGNAATGDPGFGPLQNNGGPTETLVPTSPLAIDAGDSTACPTTDQRFFVRPVSTCDIGAVEVGAARDLTAPACAVTRLVRGPDQQDVTLSDAQGGLGPDAVFPEQVTITNGNVSFTPLAAPFRSPAGAPAPSNGGLVLTAAKSDQSQKTRWSFIARDWAGNTRTCS